MKFGCLFFNRIVDLCNLGHKYCLYFLNWMLYMVSPLNIIW